MNFPWKSLLEAVLLPFATKIILKSFSKSLWNWFLDEFSMRISSGSSFAPFLQLKAFWNQFQNHLEINFWVNFPRIPSEYCFASFFATKTTLKSLSKSLWNHFLEDFSRKMPSGSSFAPFFASKITWKSVSKSLWNHFLEDFSRKFSSGSSFAPFLQLKLFWNHCQNHFEITFWVTFPGKCHLEAVLLHFCN